MNIKKLQLTVFILAIIGVAPFTILSEIFSVDHRIFSIFYRTSFLVLSLYLLWNTDIKKIFKEKHIQLFLLFFLFYFIRVLADTIFYPKELGFPIIKYYTFTWGLIIIPTLAFNFEIKKKDLKKAFKIILPVFFFICIYSLYVSNFQFENGSERLWGGFTLHPIGLGHIAVTNIIITIFFLTDKTKLKNQLFFAFNILISLITLSLTESRGPIVALVVLLFIFLFFIVEPKSKKYFQIIMAILFLLILFLVFITKFDDRVLFTINHGGARIEHWKVAIAQFIESPIVGSSLEEKVRHIYPHNIIIESFMALGIIGGVLFLLQLKNYLSVAIKNLKASNNTKKWIVLIFVQFFISAMVSGNLIGNNLFWYLGFLLMNNKKNEFIHL